MPDQPNVLFFFPDQLRYDYGGFHGDVPVRTPDLGRLTEEGVAFRNAVVRHRCVVRRGPVWPTSTSTASPRLMSRT